LTQRPDSGPRIQIVDALRGVAAMAVGLFHFTLGNPSFLSSGPLYSSGVYGWAGVDAFFVISGFIIPTALAASNYHLRSYFTFLLRRIVRLDPPYLVSVILVVVLNYLAAMAPGYAGGHFAVSWTKLLLHVGYLNGLMGVPWYGVVYWTLAIELQFYLLMGAIFPLVSSRREVIGFAIPALLTAASFVVRDQAYLLAFGCPFAMGIVVYRFRAKLLGSGGFFLQTSLIAAGTWFTLGLVPMAVGLVSAGLIAFVDLPEIRFVQFLGAISYSFYLLHVPVGGRVINLATRLNLSELGKLGAVTVASGLSLVAAYVLYRLVEVPAHRLARRFTWHYANGAS
jgi:peptidoglycan/LPS O-acetylase OafA/YrhL